MVTSTFTPNIQLSEFALKLRRYRQSCDMTTSEAAAQLGVSIGRYNQLELDKVKPTSIEKWRLNRLLAKQKTASTK